jgi:RNA polymerase sigma-70 factor (ECF subfamily)
VVPIEETQLIARIQNGDHAALKALFTHYHTLLCRLASALLKDPDQAKDVVQEVFIKIWRNRHDIRITTSLKAYLKRAVVNTSLNYLEQNNASLKLPVEKADQQHSAYQPDTPHEYQELVIKVDVAIQQLPVRTRTVFTLIRSEEMSYKEVSDSLDISVKAVEKEMMKALRLLREALKDYLPVLLVLSSLLG